MVNPLGILGILMVIVNYVIVETHKIIKRDEIIKIAPF